MFTVLPGLNVGACEWKGDETRFEHDSEKIAGYGSCLADPAGSPYQGINVGQANLDT